MRAVVWDTGWGNVTICDVREPEPHEREQFAAEVRDRMLYSAGRERRLHHVRSDDLFDLLGHHQGYFLPGCSNRVWILTAEQEDALIRLEEARAPQKVDDTESTRDTAAVATKVRDAGQEQIIRQSLVPCDDRVKDCSLDVLQVVALPDGRVIRRRIHTH